MEAHPPAARRRAAAPPTAPQSSRNIHKNRTAHLQMPAPPTKPNTNPHNQTSTTSTLNRSHLVLLQIH
ncbi:hypothetical protein M758_5G149600 [Ceratodon purpureus]|nr:hypothetical protein M758_5G149600 [Ceratodon purpureus]